jgi:hypothetical protein
MATLKTEEEEILTFDVSDEALEIAGTVSDKANFTFGVCTYEQVGCPPSIIPHPGRVRSDIDMRA